MEDCVGGISAATLVVAQLVLTCREVLDVGVTAVSVHTGPRSVSYIIVVVVTSFHGDPN